MQRRAFHWILIFTCLGTLSAFAQEGHPLTGTWTGDWGLAGAARNHVTFVMNWNGEQVTGTINPGPDAVPISSVMVDVTNWNVRIEADMKDKNGSPVHISAEGRIENLGSYHRFIAGTWRQGAASGDFKITRN